MENFANLHAQISQINYTLSLEGTFKKNKILMEIKQKPNFLVQHKKNSFIFTIPLSYRKGIINKEIPTILPPTSSISNLAFPFLSKINSLFYQTWGSLHGETMEQDFFACEKIPRISSLPQMFENIRGR